MAKFLLMIVLARHYVNICRLGKRGWSRRGRPHLDIRLISSKLALTEQGSLADFIDYDAEDGTQDPRDDVGQ